MGSCRDGERFAKKRRNCWRKWVHAEMEKDLPKKGETVGGNGFMQRWRKIFQNRETVGGNGFMERWRKICLKRETVGGNGFMQRWRKICKKETVGGNGFMQRLRKICEKEIAGGYGFMHGFFFWVSCANLQKFQSCNLCSAQEKRTQNKPIFFKNQALVSEEQASKQASKQAS
jgi:hypothetical protein